MQDLFDTYLPWFTLREIPFIGNVTIKKLIHAFGSPEGVFNASDEQLSKIIGVGTKIIRNIRGYKQFEPAATRELEKVMQHGCHIAALNDDHYPVLLKKISDPPPVLTFIGTIDNESPCISIVGSRNATAYGLSTARNLAVKLACKGFQIVSGMARGIDTMAHHGALSCRGRTIAVLGSGLKRIYPEENKKLFQDITGTGTVISEFKVDAPPMAANFPTRNRIIAGLSCGTVVVEAAKKSGSLITARLAAEYNREVFAVPGSIKSLKSEGTHALLKKGACLVESELDIIDELHQFIHKQHRSMPLSRTTPSEQRSINSKDGNEALLNLIGPYPIHIDTIFTKSGMDCSTVTTRLLDLELAGKISRHPGNYYSISEENH